MEEHRNQSDTDALLEELLRETEEHAPAEPDQPPVPEEPGECPAEPVSDPEPEPESESMHRSIPESVLLQTAQRGSSLNSRTLPQNMAGSMHRGKSGGGQICPLYWCGQRS